ncbi:MAG: hypothetical protein U1F98_11995 [Verrucomicrobiota bacterium]
MKSPWLIPGLAALAVALSCWLLHPPAPAPLPARARQPQAGITPALSSQPAQAPIDATASGPHTPDAVRVDNPDPAPVARTAASPVLDTSLPVPVVMENVRTVFHSYSSRFGGNPVGTNPEITAALNGQNPGRTVFLDPAAGLRINASGELVDPWGTPFFFHQLSRNVMEIRSAGPDGKMWTADDVVLK